ncbi:MAG: hypothetical protein U0792_06105 [Gemmataceae bacterium]
MFALALVLAFAPVPKTEAADWKPVIKDRAFKLEEAQTAMTDAITAAKKAGYAIEYTGDPNGFGSGDYTFAKKDGQKVTVVGHARSAFVLNGDTLYFADFSAISTGCKIVSYDLATGKKIRETQLEGLGPIAHTKYRNTVVMSVEKHSTVKDAFVLVITSQEAAGAYIEVIDLVTGKQLAHKKFHVNDLPKP